MAQIVMLKDHNGKKMGDIVQIPFLDGRGLVQEGIAVYWDGKPIIKDVPVQIKAVPPIELKTVTVPEPEPEPEPTAPLKVPEFDGDRIGDEGISESELEALTAPSKNKNKKSK